MTVLLPYQYPATRNETMRLIALMAMQMAVKNRSNLEILIFCNTYQSIFMVILKFRDAKILIISRCPCVLTQKSLDLTNSRL